MNNKELNPTKKKQFNLFEEEASYVCEVCGTKLKEAKDLCGKEACSKEWEKRFENYLK